MTQALTLSQPLQGLRLRAERLLRAYPREAIGVGVLTFALAVAVGGAAYSTHEGPSATAAAPPAPPPLLLKQVPPAQAVQINQSIPVASGPNPAAQPFLFKGNAAARSQALQCLASAVYYEAGNQD